MKHERPAVTCNRCGHTWAPYKAEPKQCPQCTTTLWNKPRVRPIAESRKAKRIA
jgi:predicted Zn-ribbon and HTH transcriptional regulator